MIEGEKRKEESKLLTIFNSPYLGFCDYLFEHLKVMFCAEEKQCSPLAFTFLFGFLMEYLHVGLELWCITGSLMRAHVYKKSSFYSVSFSE